MTSVISPPSLNDSDLVSISDLSKEEIDLILRVADRMAASPDPDLLKGKILASCFFEPSTRTRLSFESAMLKLGGSVIGFSDILSTSGQKGESLSDAIRTISSYADILAIRHPKEGAARLAADAARVPVVNAGDGANQHPTQTLVDLYSILKCQGRVEGLHVALAGDLRFGRTVHSLSYALAQYGARLYFVSPENLSLPDSTQHELRKKGAKFSFHTSLDSVLPRLDILYMTRIQKERFAISGAFLENPCRLSKNHLVCAKPHLKVLHPLPRIDEIDPRIDETPFAYYFEQAGHGVPVRMALLALLLGKL